MSYTPFANLSDDEYVTHLSTKDNPTDEDVESMLRIERLQEELDELRERLGAPRPRRVETKYAHA